MGSGGSWTIGSNRCILFLSLTTQFGLSLEPPLRVVARGVCVSLLPNPWPWHRPSLALWPRLIPVAWPPGCLGALRAATEARAKYLCTLQAHCQPSVASAQCLPLAAPTRPVVAADGGDWHHVVSGPATSLGLEGARAPGTHPALSTQMPSPPACQLPFPLLILPPASSLLHHQHCIQQTKASTARGLQSRREGVGPASASSSYPAS